MTPYEEKCAWCCRVALKSDMYITVRKFINMNYHPGGALEVQDIREESLYFDKHSCRNEYLYGM